MHTTTNQTLLSRPTADDLHQSAHYQLIESFPIDQTMEFFRRELGFMPQPPSPATRLTGQAIGQLIGVTLVAALLGFVVSRIWLRGTDGQLITTSLWQFGVGFVGFFIILPLHELIHGWMYRIIGADRVGYSYSLKSMMVYAYSQKFPVTHGELALVAAMPFAIITSCLAAGWLLLPSYGACWFTLLLLHTSGCLGDFALIAYWYRNRHRQLYTYDDVEDKKHTYFFAVR